MVQIAILPPKTVVFYAHQNQALSKYLEARVQPFKAQKQQGLRERQR